MRRARDSQRSRVYTAERAARPDEFSVAHDVAPTLDDVHCDMIDVIESPHYQLSRGPSAEQIDLRSSGRNMSASWNQFRRRLRMPPWARTPHVLCHELAHALANATHGTRVEPHGGVFCRHFIELVRENISQEYAADLTASFNRHRVRVASLRELLATRIN